VSDGVSRRHHRSPAMAIKPTGQDPERVDYALQARTVTLCSQHKSSPFWIILSLAFGSDEYAERHTHVRRRGPQRVNAGGIGAFGPVNTPLPKGKTLYGACPAPRGAGHRRCCEHRQREDDHPRSSLSDTRPSMHAAGRHCPDRPAASYQPRRGQLGELPMAPSIRALSCPAVELLTKHWLAFDC